MDELIKSAQNPAAVMRELKRLELAVAALDLANLRRSEEPMNFASKGPERDSGRNDNGMPRHLRDAIVAKGTAYVAKQYGPVPLHSQPMVSVDLDSNAPEEFLPRGVMTRRTQPGAVVRSVVGRVARQVKRLDGTKMRDKLTWFVAAASLLLLAMFIRQKPAAILVDDQEQASELAVEQPSIELVDELVPVMRQRQAFIQTAPDLLKLNWRPAEVGAGSEDVSGDVVWSDLRQEGFMTFSGMPINDPNQFRYQAWIFNKDINQRFPVDGGIFDIDSRDQSIVPLSPHLKIDQAVQFMVTQEQPSGAVVSARTNVSVLATLAE